MAAARFLVTARDLATAASAHPWAEAVRDAAEAVSAHPQCAHVLAHDHVIAFRAHPHAGPAAAAFFCALVLTTLRACCGAREQKRRSGWCGTVAKILALAAVIFVAAHEPARENVVAEWAIPLGAAASDAAVAAQPWAEAALVSASEATAVVLPVFCHK